jgi:hypothetical protein
MDYFLILKQISFLFNVTKNLFLVTLLFLGFSFIGFSQIKYEFHVIDKENQRSIPFSKIYFYSKSKKYEITSNEEGKFISNEDILFDSIRVISPTYISALIQWSEIQNNQNVIVALEHKIKEIDEVVVSKTSNLALKIIERVVKNRKINNFLNYDQYHYLNYSKIVYDIKSDTLNHISDSLDYGKKKYSKLKALMISESLIDVKSRNEGKLIAQRTSGISSTFISKLLTTALQHQISFYSDEISIFQIPVNSYKSIVNYLSPVSNEAINGYNYLLQETIIKNNDTIYVIKFIPKVNSNFNGLKGIVEINSNGYAIQNIMVEPSLESTLSFKLSQNFSLVGNKWYPSELSGEIWFKDFSYGNKAFPYVRVYSKNSNISLINELNKKDFQIQKIEVDEILISKSDSLLSIYRPNELTKREMNTYAIVDSIGRLKKSDYWVSLAPKLMNGKFPISIFDLDFKSLYSKNRYEKYRFGINLITNEKLSSRIVLGGFLGYGFQDDKMKYGANFSLVLNEKRFLFLTYSFQNNIKEIGKNSLEFTLTPTINDYFRSYVSENFDKCVENKIELTGKPIRFFKFFAGFNVQNIQPINTTNGLLKWHKLPYNNNEIHLGVEYNHKEELMKIGNQRRINFSGNPQVKMNYYRGISFVKSSDVIYSKIETSVNYVFYKGRIGQTNVKLCGGIIDKVVPVSLMFTGDGVNSPLGKWVLYDYFQTMSVNEFVSSTYVNLFFRHNFGDLLFQVKKFKPQINIVQNTGWGIIQKTDPSELIYRQKNNVYLESGIVINNLLKVKLFNIAYAGLGIGVFYRYGYYHKVNLVENFTIKLAYLYSLR